MELIKRVSGYKCVFKAVILKIPMSINNFWWCNYMATISKDNFNQYSKMLPILWMVSILIVSVISNKNLR